MMKSNQNDTIKMTKPAWNKWLKDNFKKTKDFNGFWDSLSIQILALLLKTSKVKIPEFGSLTVKIKGPTKPYFSMYYNKVIFPQPKSKLVFKPNSNFNKLFNNISLSVGDIEKISEGSFDWFSRAKK